jgi:carboxyl-terminal processing protease
MQLRRLVALILALGCFAIPGRTQEFTHFQREQALQMLQDVAADVKEHYYDPTFHGVDWDAKVREAKERIEKTDSMNQSLTYIAATLDSLNDSHTFLFPPPRPYSHDYGFSMQMIGDRCYMVRVHPGSDAEAQGLKPGDEITSVNGYKPTRDGFWKIEYIYNILQPQPSLRIDIRAPNGGVRQMNVAAKVTQRSRVRHLYDFKNEGEDRHHSLRVRYAEKGKELLIVKIPEFILSVSEVDAVIAKMRKYDNVILDLRGNPGGSEETLQYLMGGVFEKEVKIFERVTRNATKELKSKLVHPAFTGKLVVLVDCDSSSASESFARVIQIEKRGTVWGDRSSGRLMEAKEYVHTIGTSRVLAFADSVTEAELKMSDGGSLEHIGVNPDSLVLPDPTDLATGRDPVISKAAEALDVKVTPEEAGTFFPFEWPKE